MVLVKLIVYIIAGYFVSYWIEDYVHCRCWKERFNDKSEAEKKYILRKNKARVYMAAWFYFLLVYLWIVGQL